MRYNNQNEPMDFLTFQQKVGKYEIQSQLLDIMYKHSDPRAWSAVVNPGTHNIVVTYFINRKDLGERNFDIISSRRNFYEVDTDDVFQTLDLIVNHDDKNTVVDLSSLNTLNSINPR